MLEFKPKKDLLFKMTILWNSYIFIVVSLLIAMFVFLDLASVDLLLFSFLFLLFGVIGVLAWNGFKYRIEGGAFKIMIYNFSLFEIWLSQIITIEKKRSSFVYVYAFSFDCISLKTKDGEVNISLINPDLFASEIMKINTHTHVNL